ncbi:hypothetical protein AAFF_G00195860 [Aldrovandia affinis]|uniref:Uncharacterized protein n=1 Tax=Aldrovandia affinis TaxID=143900 RepID=A0AAD7RLL8_9TELE|nr:hypothetical protein AAFF_G00195860 [Aldrovandia affinis]
MSKAVFYLPVKFKKNFCHEATADQAKQLGSAVSLEELKEAVASRQKVTQVEDVTNIGVKTINSTSPPPYQCPSVNHQRKVDKAHIPTDWLQRV